jgi:hypothetical protein
LTSQIYFYQDLINGGIEGLLAGFKLIFLIYFLAVSGRIARLVNSNPEPQLSWYPFKKETVIIN